MAAVFFIFPVLFSLCGAAIRPEEKNYQASVGDDVQFTWNYDDENQMFSVDWTFQSETAASPESIMTQSSGSPATAENNYDVEHSGNGIITLKNVTMDSSGKYFCVVSYNIGASLSPVIGTATLTVTATTDGTPKDNDNGLSTGAIVGIVIGVAVVVIIIIVVILAIMKKLPCKGDKDDTSRDPESTRSSPKKAENKLLNKEKQSSATGKADGGNKGKQFGDTQIHNDKSQKVIPENEEKPFRPQPLPPPGAKLNHSLAEDNHRTGAGDSFSLTKLPPITKYT